MTNDATQRDAQMLINQAASSTVSGLFASRARIQPNKIALAAGQICLTYGELDERVNRLASQFAKYDVVRGDRIAVLSGNCNEYLEIMLAAARVGAVVACQNSRLAPMELQHCIELAQPRIVIVSAEHRPALAACGASGNRHIVELGEPYDELIASGSPLQHPELANPEDPLLLLYTSGTTGLPKGAVISHRAEIARNLVVCAEFGVTRDDTFVAWSPLYHMGAAELSLGTLMTGGKVAVVNGFDVTHLARLVEDETLGWLLIMPGMAEAFAEELERRDVKPRGVKLCGVMADLVPPHVIARVTRLLDAPFANTFGATETGCPPCSSNRIPVGATPRRLSKEQSPFCEVRLVDEADEEVPVGVPGELTMRGPTLFSGYWMNDAANQTDFRGGWFHMGDVFVRNADGSLDFVDRLKYLIKSGGENIYPAEIERVLLRVPGVADAAVVRQADARWGEVPIAFVARDDESVTESLLYEQCREALAGFKQPKGIRFIDHDDFPRSASGKIQRHELERRLT